MWNGTAEILKARPTSRNTRPMMRPMSVAAVVALAAVAMAAKLVEPVKP